MLDSIKDYHVSKKEAHYIPILDRDPKYAAKFLTKVDLAKSYKLLKEVYDGIKKGEVLHRLLHDTVMDSKDNFYWFSEFFKTLEKSANVLEWYEIPVDKCPDNFGYAPKVFQPFYVNSAPKGKGAILSYCGTNVKEQDPINNYRIKYIAADYDMSDFQDDQFPGWYILKNTTVYEQYNEKTNRRVRIDFRDGYFLYFIAGASDNWQMIPDVPIEMTHIISALLFRHLD